MPDLAVCLTSALEGKAQLAVGDVLGSNIFDILLVTGVVALVAPGPLKRQAWHFDVPVLLLSSVALFIVADDKIIDNTPDNIINRTDGLLLLFIFTFYMTHVLKGTSRHALHHAPAPAPDQAQPSSSHPSTHPLLHSAQSPHSYSLPLAIAMIVGGFALLVLGGQWMVKGASALARAWGMSEALIGLSIVGIGSGIPDLASSLIAAVKKQPALALGNILGACIFNVFFIIGVCAGCVPLRIEHLTLVDFTTLIGASALLLVFCTFMRRHRLTRLQGVILVAGYVAYAAYLILTALHR